MSIRPGTQDENVSLRLHAELLPNIRQITLYASLPRIPELEGFRPVIQLSDLRKEATISLPPPFDHVSEPIKLPARVSDAYRRLVNARSGAAVTPVSTQSTDTSQDYSFRMQVDSSDEALLLSRDELIDDYVPWTAADMSLSTRICCQRCGNMFLKTKTSSSETGEDVGQPKGWIWKDLPSGNWAEMMDFWHCHKPDPHEDNQDGTKNTALRIEDQTAQLKGYGAASRVVAISGTVLIDAATFLLVESDCMGLVKVGFVLSLLSLHIVLLLFFSGQLRRRPSLFHGVALRYYCPIIKPSFMLVGWRFVTDSCLGNQSAVIFSCQMDFALWFLMSWIWAGCFEFWLNDGFARPLHFSTPDLVLRDFSSGDGVIKARDTLKQ